MSKLTIMQGLPGSGKSTESKRLTDNSQGVRLNKDLLREMLNFNKFNGKSEGLVQDAEMVLANHFLSTGVNVIIDDTNLNPKTFQGWLDVGKKYNKEGRVEVVTIDTKVGDCIARDFTREKSVGKDVIIKMAMQYKDFLKGEKFVICDLDGTLCDVTHRLHFLQGDTKDWKGFFGAMSEDPLREDVAEKLVNTSLEAGARIIYVSARPEMYRKATEDWFEAHGVKGHYLLIMRPNNDSHEDSIIKREIYDKYLKGLDIVKVFDDRPRVIVNTWIPLLGKDKVVDVGNNSHFVEEREELNYWTE